MNLDITIKHAGIITKYFLELFEPQTIAKLTGLAIALIFLFLATKIINKIVSHAFRQVIKRTEDIEARKHLDTIKIVTTSSIAAFIGALAIFHTLNTLGVDIRPLLATAGIVGVAVGFGAKRFVEDIISGLSIILSGQARVGDIVQINSITGTVERVNLRMIVLRGSDGAVHYIRNGLIDIISNSTRDYSVAVFEIHIGYKENPVRIIDIIKELGKNFKHHPEHGAHVLSEVDILGLDRFEDSSMVIKFTLKTPPAKQFVVQRAFNLILKEKFDELGISMPYPHLVVCNNE